jgi:hypothetical protein
VKALDGGWQKGLRALFAFRPRHGYLLISTVALMHALQGVAILTNPLAIEATPVLTVARWFGNPSTAALAFLVVAVLAVLANVLTVRHATWLALPQQAFLIAAAVTAISAVVEGQYADGTVIPAAHIFADQIGFILLALMHPIALLHIYRNNQ